MQFEITSLENLGEIKIDQMQDKFLDEKENKNSVNNSTHIRTIKFNQDNLKNVLGENFNVRILEKNGNEIAKITKDSQWDENKEITVNLEEKDLETIEIILNKPEQIGTLKISIGKYIDGETGYEKEQLKNFTKLENTKIISTGEQQITVNSTEELKDTETSAKLSLSTTNLSSINKNTNVQIIATLKADSNAYDLYKNPYVEIKLPNELEQIKIHSINRVYGDEFEFKRAVFIPETKSIVLELEGEQTEYKTKLQEGIQIAISADLIFTKNTPTKDITFGMIYKNENGKEEQYQTQTAAKLNSKYGAIIYNNIFTNNPQELFNTTY